MLATTGHIRPIAACCERQVCGGLITMTVTAGVGCAPRTRHFSKQGVVEWGCGIYVRRLPAQSGQSPTTALEQYDGVGVAELEGRDCGETKKETAPEEF